MRETLSSEDRRTVRASLITSLAVVATLLGSTLAFAGVNSPAGRSSGASLSAAAPAAVSVPAEETSNESIGCGCAEACLAAY